MSVTVFLIDAYVDLIQQNHEYFVSNPTIRTVEEQYRSKSGEYQMTFNSRTTIQPTGSATQKSEPSYYTISTIPRNSGFYDRFDILGIILFIGENRIVNGAFDQKNSVSEIVIIDHSSHQPLSISAWNDLSDFFKEKSIAYSVFGFTSLRVTSHKGFGLSTTMSSSITTALTGEKAELLRKWASSHAVLLHERKQQVLQSRISSTNRQMTTIASIKKKTIISAANTIQDERHWIKAFITNCSYDDIRKFLGCNGCNKKIDTKKNEVFTCQWCHKKDSISMPRLALSFDAQDDTRSMNLTAFNDTVAQLFGRTISELYAPETYDKISTYQEIAESLKAKPIYIELGPTTALAKNGVLKWVLKSISLKTIASQESKNKGLLLPTSSSTTVLPTDKKQDQLFTPPSRKGESSLKLSTPAINNTPLDSQLPSSTSVVLNSESVHNSEVFNSEATPQTEAELKVRQALDFSVVESSINPEDSIY